MIITNTCVLTLKDEWRVANITEDDGEAENNKLWDIAETDPYEAVRFLDSSCRFSSKEAAFTHAHTIVKETKGGISFIHSPHTWDELKKRALTETPIEIRRLSKLPSSKSVQRDLQQRREFLRKHGIRTNPSKMEF